MVFDLPLTEDGYYVMTVARNVARGVGFSVDGTTLTNGFQPLWAVPSSLAFVAGAGSDELSMRTVAAIQSGTLAFFVDGAINLDGRVNYAAHQARRAGKLVDYLLAQRIGLLVDYEIYLEPERGGYFTPADNPKPYFRKVAPPGTARPYEWVAQRRIAEPAR